MKELKWSKREKEIAQRAFDRAYQLECGAIAKDIITMATSINEPDELWLIHDFLTKKRKEIDGKYNSRYSEPAFVFARLLSEGWLTQDDLTGLSDDKITPILKIAEIIKDESDEPAGKKEKM